MYLHPPMSAQHSQLLTMFFLEQDCKHILGHKILNIDGADIKIEFKILILKRLVRIVSNLKSDADFQILSNKTLQL